MLPLETLLWGFALPALLIAGSVLLSRGNAWLQALACAVAAGCAQWAHFAELAPLTAAVHSSRDWIWLLVCLGALLGLSSRPQALPGLLGPLGVAVLSLRLGWGDWPLWQRCVAGLLLGLGVVAAARPESAARSALLWLLLFATTAGALLLAHSATLALYAAGFALALGMVFLGQWKRPQHELTRPARAALATLLAVLVLSAWLFADLPLASALCLVAALLALGWPAFWPRAILVGLLCAASLASLLASQLPTDSNPYR